MPKFRITPAQQRALDQITELLKKLKVINRLLEADSFKLCISETKDAFIFFDDQEAVKVRAILNKRKVDLSNTITSLAGKNGIDLTEEDIQLMSERKPKRTTVHPQEEETEIPPSE